MPIYEYICESCGARHEAFQKFSDPLLTQCPKCKGKLKKLISNTSFVLKGTGWYVTDYARKGTGSGSSGNGKKKAGAPEKKTGAQPAAAAKSEKGKPAPAPKPK
ncbi:MAG: transcriptional regulator [Nitrospiraceae bacterium]|nr:transcriptional regulator [Nitrospiraceae bacterium]